MELKTKHLAVVVPSIFIVGIGLTMAFNLWHTTTTKEPAKYASGEFAGQANPADIRGSYTFGDVVAAFPGVPLEVLADAFGVTGNAAAFAVKDLESSEVEAGAVAVGTDSVRLFVARWLGLAFEPAEGTGLPPRAIELLEAAGATPTVAAPAAAPAKAPAPAATAAVQPAAAPTATPAAQPAATPAATPAAQPVAGDRAVKGSTTFGQLADWGVAPAALEETIGGVPGAPGTTVRDWCTEKGIEFSTIKTKVQSLVDAAAP
jgi:pyruvate/2-oxoglutarate dehydrogenase complex dihydrolipoamide acyltransferase (E2) component